MENINVEEIKKKRGRPNKLNGQYDKHKYYETFKQKNHMSEKILCECGQEITKYSLEKHKNRKFHKLTMQIKTMEKSM